LQAQSDDLNVKLEQAKSVDDEGAIIRLEHDINGVQEQMQDNMAMATNKRNEMAGIEERYDQNGDLSQYVNNYNDAYTGQAEEMGHSFTAEDADRLESLNIDLD